MEKVVNLKPYDREVAEDVFSVLFNHIEHETEDGLQEVPAASYQLVVSALECLRWDVRGEDREILKRATGIVEELRDRQKMREWRRERRYMVKPEYLDKWLVPGESADAIILGEEYINRLAYEWGVAVDDLMEQVEEI